MQKMKDGGALLRVGRSTVAILSGSEDVSTWSDEELKRGKKRSKNGDWSGRPPTVVPKAIHDEIVRRKMRKAYDLLRINTYRAVRVLAEIALDKTVDPAIRTKAATEILDRGLGKPVERMNIQVDAPWQQLMAQAIVPALPDGTIEGEVVEDDELTEVEWEAEGR